MNNRNVPFSISSSSSSLFLFVCLLAAAITIPTSYANILPILSDYTQVVKINGQLTTQRHIQVAVSDLNDHGVITVGSTTVEIDARDPIEFLYATNVISTVPWMVGTGIAKAAEAGDLDVFNSSAAINGEQYGNIVTTTPEIAPGVTTYHATNSTIHHEPIRSRAQWGSSRVMTIKRHSKTVYNFPVFTAGGGSGLKSPRRRLLQFDFATAALTAYNTYQIEKLKGQMSAMDGRVTKAENMIADQADKLKTLTGITDDIVHNLTLQTDINRITTNNLNKVQDQVSNITNAINATNNAIAQLNIDVTNQITSVINGTKAALASVQEKFNTQFGEVYIELANMYSLQSNMTTSQLEQNNRLNKDILALGRQLRSSLSLAWDASQGVSIERSLVDSLFEAASGIPPETFILKTDDGTPPHQGLLNGTFARFFIERVTVSWIDTANAQTQQGSVYGFREDYSIYIDTMMGIHNDKPWNTWDDTISLMGPEICLRPYTDADFPLDSIDINATLTGAPGCQVWIESRRTSCEIDTNKLPNGFTLQQSGALDNTVCLVGSTYTSNYVPIKHVFRNLDVFNSYVAQLYKNPNRKASANTLLVNLQRVGGRTIVIGPKNPADADLPWNVAQRILDYQTLQVYINIAIEYAFPFVQADLKDREQLIFGRAFDGIDESPCPITTQPTIRKYDPETQQLQIVYDGAAKKTRCKQAIFGYVADKMIEVNSAEPYSLKPSNINITIKSVTPAGNGSWANHVTTQQVATSFQYTLDAPQTTENTFYYMGDIDPSVYGVTFDIPDDFFCGERTYAACKGKVDFYNDEPGTQITPTLAQWKAKSSSRQFYNPKDFGDSPHHYMRGFVTDEEGYPKCNVPGGVSLMSQLQNAINGGTFKPQCRGSFDWFEGNFDNQQASAIKCNGLVDPSMLWYSENTTLISSSSLISSPSLFQQPWSFSFQYRTTQSSFVILVATSTDNSGAGVKLTITGGSSIIVNINNGASVATVPIHHDIEGAVHNVWIQWDNTDSNRLTIYSDLIQILNSPNFAITPTTGLGASSISTGSGVGSSNLANVLFNIRYSNIAYSSANVAKLLLYSSCHYSKILPNRCDVTTDTVNGPLPDTRSVVYAYQVPDSTCVGIDSILLTDPVATRGQDLPASGLVSYSLSWWSDRVDFAASPTFTPAVNLGGWIVQFSRTQVRFQSTSDSNVIQDFTLNNSPSLSASNGHFFMFVSDSISSTLKLYIDKIDVTPTSGNYPAFAAGGNVATSIFFYPRFTMGRLYYHNALNSGDRTTAFNCELGTTISDTSSWRTPLATCIVSQYSTQTAYCRFAGLCSGKCSVFTSSLDLERKTYTIDTLQCDPYYQGTNCQTLCPRTTPNGYCLSDTDPYAQLTNNTSFQSVPGSHWCNFLKHNKVKALPTLSNGQKLLSAKPEHWTGIITLVVPQGDIVQDITTGVCPTVSSTALNSSLLGFKLTNPGSVDSLVRVQWVSTADSIANDDPSCSYLYELGTGGLEININANYYQFFKTPPCNNAQIQIQLFVGGDVQWQNCGGPIDSSSFPDIISNSVLVPDNVASAIVISQDETFKAINQQQISSWVQSVDMQYQSALASGAGQAMLDSLQAFKTHLQNVTTTSNVLLSFDDVLQMPVNGSVGGQTFKDYLAQSSSIAAATSASARDRSDIALLQQKNDQLTAFLNATMVLLGNLSSEEAQSLAQYIKDVQAGRDAFNAAGAGDFPNPFDALGSAAKWVGGTLIPGLGNFLGGALGLGGFGAWIEKIIETAIIIAIAVFAAKWWIGRKANTEKEKVYHVAQGHAKQLTEELTPLTEKTTEKSVEGRHHRRWPY